MQLRIAVAASAAILLIQHASAESPRSLRSSTLSNSKSTRDVDPTSRELMEDTTDDGHHHATFSPLLCNGDFSMDCVPLNVANVTSSMYVVPCGECQILTESVAFEGGLNVEGHLQILPPVDVASVLSIEAPYIIVQGKLALDMESESYADRRGGIHIELVEGDGADLQLVPHAENSMACVVDPTKCNVGKKAFVVAGGQIDIRGYDESCPSWTNLVDVVNTGVTMPQLDASEYEHPPQPPSEGCSAIAVWQDFEDQSSPFPNEWDGGGAEYGVKSYASGGHYFEVTGNGPHVYLAEPECLTPGAQYLFSVDIMLSTLSGAASACSQSGGWECPKLIIRTSSNGRWGRRLGLYKGKNVDDGVWASFQEVVTFTEEDVSSSWAFLKISGVGPDVKLSIDNFLLELAPPETYLDPNQACAQLLPNGDAQSSSGGNIFPLTTSGGRGAVVEEDGGNKFFRQSGRYAHYNRLEAKVNTGCLVQDAMYKVSAKVQVHWPDPTAAEIVVASAQPNGSTHYSTLLLCPESDENSGFVYCERQLSLYPELIAATSVTLLLRPRGIGASASMVDWDDLSIEYVHVEGPVEEVLVDPTMVHDCWAGPTAEGAEFLLTSHTLDYMDHQVVSTSGMTADGKISLTSPIVNPMSGEDDFSVEVALLSRRITLEASSVSGSSIGGHLIVFHTPGVNQTIRGMEIKGFGQQGNLGRYPIHFHMSNNVEGSVVSKNVIRDSHQRCIVVHGTNSLLIEDNVAYNTAGHCFMLEDGGEINNVFRNNLGAATKKVSTLISNDETDDEPSTFWITNPQNSFENNVAAGSEGSGYWFELRTRVRGPSAALHPGVNPSRLPLQSFVSNVAHSNGAGMITYPGAGYSPLEEAAFIDSKMYRNRGSGIFFHNSGNFLVQGGTFSDNSIGIDVDRAHSLRIIGADFIGITPSFAALLLSYGKIGHCASSMNTPKPVIGVELHSQSSGGTERTGVVLEDTSFAHFGDSVCEGSSALGVDSRENFGFFDPRHSIKGLTFDADTSKLNLCKAVASGINVAIEDKDASIGPLTGFIVSSNSNMTTFASCTELSDVSCASFCANTCLRTLSLSVSSYTEDDLQLVVEETGGDSQIQLLGYNIATRDEYWNTRSAWTRRFFATLPADKSYSANFMLDNNPTWPVFVERSWEDTEGCDGEFTLELGEGGDKNCDQLIVNGNAEDNISGWWHTAGGIKIEEGGLSSQSREYSSWGISQFLDTRCMVLDRTYMLSASTKLVNEDGSAYVCVQGPVAYNQSPCPKAWLRSRVGTTNPVDSYLTIATTINTSSTGDWDTMVGTFTVTEAQANAGSVLLAWYGAPAHVKVILDNITLSCVSGCEEQLF